MNKREQNKIDTMHNIQTAFIKIYSKKGIEGVSINDLCKESDIVKSTFYTYYDDKYSVLDDIKKNLLLSLDEIIITLSGIELSSIGDTMPLDKAVKVIEFISENKAAFKAILGPHGDPSFEIRWKQDIENSFLPKFKEEKGDSKNAEIACTIFSSSLIGIYRYFIFKNSKITNREMAVLLGNILKYSLSVF